MTEKLTSHFIWTKAYIESQKASRKKQNISLKERMSTEWNWLLQVINHSIWFYGIIINRHTKVKKNRFLEFELIISDNWQILDGKFSLQVDVDCNAISCSCCTLFLFFSLLQPIHKGLQGLHKGLPVLHFQHVIISH